MFWISAPPSKETVWLNLIIHLCEFKQHYLLFRQAGDISIKSLPLEAVLIAKMCIKWVQIAFTVVSTWFHLKPKLTVCSIYQVHALAWVVVDLRWLFFAAASPSNRRANSFVLVKLEQIASGLEPHQYGFTQLNFLIQTPLVLHFVHPVL